MKLPPIIARELTRAARRKSTYRVRMLSVVVLLLLFVLSFNGDTPSKYLGPAIFGTLGIAILGLCMFWGLILTADSISSETEDGTLGLLFLTDLTGFDVLLQKMVANSINAFFVLLAILPVTALPFFIGGVSFAQFARVALVLGSTMVLSLSIGLAVSSACRDGRKSLALSFLTMALLAGGFPLAWALQKFVIDNALFDFLLWFSPGFAFQHSFDHFYAGGIIGSEFWCSIATLWAVSAFCYGVASYLTPRVWKVKDTGKLEIYKAARRANRSSRRRKKASVEDPYFFVADRDRGPSSAANWIVFVFATIWVLLTNARSGLGASMAFSIFCLGALHIVVKFLLAVEATSRLNYDRNSRSLELLLTTPLTPELIVRGLWRAHFRHFAPVFSVLAAINVLTWIGFFSMFIDTQMGGSHTEILLAAEVFFGGAALHFLDFRALSWLGMWNGLSKQSMRKAVISSVARIMVLCWAIGLAMLFLMEGVGGTDGAILIIGFYFLIAASISTVSASVSKAKLADDFRTTAADRNADAN